MMGRQEGGQGQFFYAFELDKVVRSDHLVRRIDAMLDLSWVHKELSPYYSHTGRPSIDPVLMIRMLIVGYVFAIRSDRRICAEVQVNLAYRWFCKLGIEDSIPDHSICGDGNSCFTRLRGDLSWTYHEGIAARVGHDAIYEHSARNVASMPWKRVSAAEPAVVGKAGLGWGYPFLNVKENEEPEKVEGDNRTPAGFFRIGRSFGFAPSRRPGYV